MRFSSVESCQLKNSHIDTAFTPENLYFISGSFETGEGLKPHQSCQRRSSKLLNLVIPALKLLRHAGSSISTTQIDTCQVSLQSYNQ